MISHKIVHQRVCFNETCSLFDVKKSKCFDYEGNEYPYKEVGIGNERTTYSVCNTIPTQVPLKTFVTFKQILPSVQGMSFVTIPVAYRAEDGGKILNDNGIITMANTSYNDEVEIILVMI